MVTTIQTLPVKYKSRYKSRKQHTIENSFPAMESCFVGLCGGRNKCILANLETKTQAKMMLIFFSVLHERLKRYIRVHGVYTQYIRRAVFLMIINMHKCTHIGHRLTFTTPFIKQKYTHPPTH